MILGLYLLQTFWGRIGALIQQNVSGFTFLFGTVAVPFAIEMDDVRIEPRYAEAYLLRNPVRTA